MELSQFKYIVFIICYTLLFLYLYIILFSNTFKDYLDENWKELRCTPYIIPFAGISNKADGSNFFSRTFSNFNSCTKNQIDSMIGVFMKPLFELIRGLTKGLGAIRSIIDKFRSMAKVIREMFSILVGNTFTRISNSYAAITYMQEKIKSIIKRQSAMFEVLTLFGTSMPFLFHSFAYGPIPAFGFWLMKYLGLLIAVIIFGLLCLAGIPFISGLVFCPLCLACFDQNTVIDNKSIKDYKIGDKIGNSTITGKLVTKEQPVYIYNYKGIRVTGSHLVFHNEKWVRISDIDNIPEPTLEKTQVVCLTTDNHNIEINGITFRDYSETSEPEIIAKINNLMKSYINNREHWIDIKDSLINSYATGYSGDTLVKTGDGQVTTIREIYEKQSYNTNIIGISKVKDTSVQWHEYKGLILSGSTIILENNNWIRVYESSESIPTDHYGNVYNLITIDNTITLVNDYEETILGRDLFESSDLEINKEIFNLLEKHLNNI